jgi:hypothetical protein
MKTLKKIFSISTQFSLLFSMIYLPNFTYAQESSYENEINTFYGSLETSEPKGVRPLIGAVAALDRDDSLASFSDYGVSSVDIAAPGVSVLSTVPGGYQRLSGTSFSAPMVAAVLSVLPLSESKQTVSLIDFLIPKAYAEETPKMTVGEFLNLLFGSVQSLTGLEGKVKGGKVLRFGESDEIVIPDDDNSEEEEGDPEYTEGFKELPPVLGPTEEFLRRLNDPNPGEGHVTGGMYDSEDSRYMDQYALQYSLQSEEDTKIAPFIEEAVKKYNIPRNVIIAFLSTYKFKNAERYMGILANDHYEPMWISRWQTKNISEESGIPEQNIRYTLKGNIFAKLFLLEKHREKLFGKKEDLTLGEWKSVFIGLKNEEKNYFIENEKQINKMLTILVSENRTVSLDTGEVLQMDPLEFEKPSDDFFLPSGLQQSGFSLQSISDDDVSAPDVVWNPAHKKNFFVAERAADDIDQIVIHAMDGLYEKSIDIYTKDQDGLGAHFFIRTPNDTQTGEITSAGRGVSETTPSIPFRFLS